MEYTNKFVLINADAASRIGQIPNVNKIYTDAMSASLSKLPNRSDIPVEFQNQEYNRQQHQYLFQKDHFNKPIKFSIGEEVDENEIKPQNILHAATNFFQIEAIQAQRAQNLARFLNTLERLNWNRRGEISIDNTVIPGSNLTTLMNDILSNRYSNSPIGSDELADLLVEAQIPRQYVAERSGKYRGAAAPHRRTPEVLLPRVQSRINRQNVIDPGEGTSTGTVTRGSLPSSSARTRGDPFLFRGTSTPKRTHTATPTHVSFSPHDGASGGPEDEDEDSTLQDMNGSGLKSGSGLKIKWVRY
jgi:hypothetical protein